VKNQNIRAENFLDTADMYGIGDNEELIAKAIKGKRDKFVEQNAAAAEVVLSQEELAAIEDVFPKDAVSGLRYPEAMMKSVNA